MRGLIDKEEMKRAKKYEFLHSIENDLKLIKIVVSLASYMFNYLRFCIDCID